MSQAENFESLIVGLCDINGQLRGKRVPASSAKKIMKSGIRMPLSTCSVDIWGNDIVGSPLVLDSGDQDAECLPTSRGIIPIDWLEKPTGFIPISMFEEMIHHFWVIRGMHSGLFRKNTRSLG